MECPRATRVTLMPAGLPKATKARRAPHGSYRAFLATTIVALLSWASAGSCTAGVGACASPTPVRFPPGAVRTEIFGGTARGELACWTIAARQGQHMAVRQTNPEGSNVVLQLYQPPWSVTRSPDGFRVQGRALPGASEGQDAKAWAGTLPSTGNYLLVLGRTWGGGPYWINIEIR